MSQEKFDLIPPEVSYMSAKYVIKLPVTDKHLKNPWELRVFAAKLLKRKIGDEVQLTSLKVKRPGLIANAKAKLRQEIPQTCLYITVKF